MPYKRTTAQVAQLRAPNVHGHSCLSLDAAPVTCAGVAMQVNIAGSLALPDCQTGGHPYERSKPKITMTLRGCTLSLKFYPPFSAPLNLQALNKCP